MQGKVLGVGYWGGMFFLHIHYLCAALLDGHDNTGEGKVVEHESGTVGEGERLTGFYLS